MDRGAWHATVHGDLKESDMTEELTLSLHFFFHFKMSFTLGNVQKDNIFPGYVSRPLLA